MTARLNIEQLALASWHRQTLVYYYTIPRSNKCHDVLLQPNQSSKTFSLPY